jgi:hypothetical protein
MHGENADVIRLRRPFGKDLHSGTDGLGKTIHCLAIEVL